MGVRQAGVRLCTRQLAKVTSAPIRAWKSNLLWEIMTDQPTNQPTTTNVRAHREITFPTIKAIRTRLEK